MRRRLSAVVAALLLAGLAAGCSDPGATTCEEYGALSYNERDKVLKDLLVAHRLEPHHVGNNLGLMQSVDTFCGTYTSVLTTDHAPTQNLSRPIDDAVDWDSETW